MYLSTKEVAEKLGVSAARIRQMILAGKLIAQKKGRDLMILESDLSHIQTYGKAGRPKKTENGNASNGAKTNDVAGKPFKTIFDLAPELCGIIKDGLPSDLSTNKKYLEGLGRD